VLRCSTPAAAIAGGPSAAMLGVLFFRWPPSLQKSSRSACVSAGIGSRMAILTTKQIWKREPNPRGRKSRAELNRLLPVEEQRVRRAMRVLHVRYRNWSAVSRALGYHRVTVERVLNIRRTATPAFAMRVARLLGVSLGEVLSGAWPKAGECLMCGSCAAPTTSRSAKPGSSDRRLHVDSRSVQSP
jgi:hypothetical protein